MSEAKPQPPVADLDVERLARALATLDDPYPDGSDYWALLGELVQPMYRDRASRVAAEYARLAATTLDLHPEEEAG